MKEIQLTRGQVALVDDADYDWLTQNKWCAMAQGPGRFCAVRRRKGKTELMHRVILGLEGRWPLVDHENNNPLDCQRHNLRIASQAQNMRNRGKTRANTTGYKGVGKMRAGKGWYARLMVDYKKVYLGTFPTPEDAAQAYNIAAVKYHGEFAYLNTIPASTTPP